MSCLAGTFLARLADVQFADRTRPILGLNRSNSNRHSKPCLSINQTTTTTMFCFRTILYSICLVTLAYSNETKPLDHSSFTQASNQFGLDLWQRLSTENEKTNPEPENLFFSSYSIATALSMVYVGSNGDTEKQIGSTLDFKQTKLEDKQILAGQVQKSSESINSKFQNSSSYSLSTANGMALDQKFQILDSYRKMLEQKFSGEIFSVNFGNDSVLATNQINRWISDKTRGKIEKMLQEPLSSNTVMVLMNAVYFKGKWRKEFDSQLTQPLTFQGASGKMYQNVDFMMQTDWFNLTRSKELSLTMVELPYIGDHLSLYAFIPEPGHGFSEMRTRLTSDSHIEQLIQQSTRQHIRITFPKLSLETRYDLVDTLKAMGIKDLFDGRADLRGISEQANLTISGVQHMAMVEVNEKGTEAAAATVMQLMTLSALEPDSVDFDRQFMFVIRHHRQTLFVGEVNRF